MKLDDWVKRDAELTSRLLLAEERGLLRRAAMVVSHSGDSWFWLVGLGLAAAFGSQVWRVRAVVLILSILVTASLVLVIKFRVRRPRPEGEWGNIYRRTDPHSFPSGHSARALMLGVVALGTGPAWFAALLLIWAPLVGLSRIALGVHYLLDVIVGLLLGGVLGGLILIVLAQLPALI